MDALPVIKPFFGKPVRFFKTSFEVEIEAELMGRNTPSASEKITIETWAIPFPDYCAAIDRPEKDIRRMIRISDEVFSPFYRIENILDRNSVQKRGTILMAQEMVNGLTLKLSTSRISDPEARARVVNFQRWVMIRLGLIRSGRVRPVRWNIGEDVPPEYIEALGLPSGKEASEAVGAIAEKEGKSRATIYRRLQTIRGTSAVTAKGRPRRTRADKGRFIGTPEHRAVMDAIREHPNLTKKEIARMAGVPYPKVIRWTRAL